MFWKKWFQPKITYEVLVTEFFEALEILTGEKEISWDVITKLPRRKLTRIRDHEKRRILLIESLVNGLVLTPDQMRFRSCDPMFTSAVIRFTQRVPEIGSEK